MNQNNVAALIAGALIYILVAAVVMIMGGCSSGQTIKLPEKVWPPDVTVQASTDSSGVHFLAGATIPRDSASTFIFGLFAEGRFYVNGDSLCLQLTDVRDAMGIVHAPPIAPVCFDAQTWIRQLLGADPKTGE